MYFKQFLNERCGCASYLIASRQSGEAAIIDPASVTEQYDALLSERGFTLRYVIDTHIHADHISGARRLAAAHGADLCLHESAEVSYPFRPLTDNAELALGQLRLRVLHTPGHRPELISLLVSNPARNPAPALVLTGDSLLVGDVGRPDFGGGSASEQHHSLVRLLDLPDWVAVFPGHFEGPCAAAMEGRPVTSIGFERRYNPLARLDHFEFVRALTASIPPRPLNMTAIEATNRGLADHAWAMPNGEAAVPEVEATTLDRRPPWPPALTILDVREPQEYALGHVPGAINLPQAELASRLDELPQVKAYLLICESGMRSLRAAQFLVQVGYKHVANVRGGTAAWRASGRPLATVAMVVGATR
jgi:glyoxylase-like metal-dependent hydrolase (beta-lactamase superfamily II)/rhodanese-related sulfurtransferase